MGSETLDYKIEIEVRIYDRYGDFAVFHHADTEVRVLLCLYNVQWLIFVSWYFFFLRFITIFSPIRIIISIFVK